MKQRSSSRAKLLLPRIVRRLSLALGTAFDALLRNPLRSSITGFGILVGVTAVTVVITLGEGAERAVQAQIERLGENLVTIRPSAPETAGVLRGDKPILVVSDAQAIREQVGGVEHVAPVVESLVRVMRGSKNAAAQAVGTTAPYFEARSYKIEAGTVWEHSQELAGARVVLVGPSIVRELFPHEEPIGQSLRMGKHLFRIIGVLSEKGQTPFGTDQDNVVVMPLITMRSKLSPGRPGEVAQIVMATAPGVEAQQIFRPVRALLRQRHHLQDGQADDFSIRDQARMASAQRGIVTVMRLLLLSIAAVSLIIGGIGVMNIMLVSVTERSREIGTRLAVGATSRDILTQFLIEAVVLSLLGGLCGALLAGLSVPPLESYFGWDLFVSPRALVVACAVSITIGVVFGFLPARRAARLDPVEALRRE